MDFMKITYPATGKYIVKDRICGYKANNLSYIYPGIILKNDIEIILGKTSKNIEAISKERIVKMSKMSQKKLDK